MLGRVLTNAKQRQSKKYPDSSNFNCAGEQILGGYLLHNRAFKKAHFFRILLHINFTSKYHDCKLRKNLRFSTKQNGKRLQTLMSVALLFEGNDELPGFHTVGQEDLLWEELVHILGNVQVFTLHVALKCIFKAKKKKQT